MQFTVQLTVKQIDYTIKQLTFKGQSLWKNCGKTINNCKHFSTTTVFLTVFSIITNVIFCQAQCIFGLSHFFWVLVL